MEWRAEKRRYRVDRLSEEGGRMGMSRYRYVKEREDTHSMRRKEKVISQCETAKPVQNLS